MKKEIICTVCPMGCTISVEGSGEQIFSVSGNHCRRGKEYASAEFCHPVRILTTTMKTDNPQVPLVPIRSERPLPREKMMECMAAVRKQTAKTPVGMHDIMIRDICGTGISMIATARVESGSAG